MAFSIGDRLGPYELVAWLGEGGMGQVFRARDTRLQREVAVKVAAEQFSERFAREAQLIASLNHPNICTLFDVGPNYLVMELIEGPTLHDRLAQGAMGLEEAVQVGLQIAEALEAAHEKGIVHRDLKPANIKLTAEGKVKVLDFGLAKALDGEAVSGTQMGNSPTLAPTRIAGTEAGFILGTVGYMAPEQARGHAVDRRADIFAFGVVLWEMVVGRRMFDGETVSDTLAQILTQAPALEEAPAVLRPLLGRCLEKDRRKRLQAIGEARIALGGPLVEAGPAVVVSAGAGSRVPWVVAGVSVAALVVCLGLLWRPAAVVEKGLVELDVEMGTPLGLTFSAGSSVVLSPDGTRIAYLDGTRRLWARRLNDPKPVMLTSDSVQGIFFSPDSRWIGFFDTRLRKVLADGGTAIALTAEDIALNGGARGSTWLEDGTIVFASQARGVLEKIAEAGGEAQAVTQLDKGRNEVTHRLPFGLPGGKAVLFTASAKAGSFDEATIDVVVLATGERKTLIRGGTHPRYVMSGHILYSNRETVFAVPFDVKRLAVTGSPVPVLTDVLYQANIGYSHLSVSRDGMVVYRRGRIKRTGEARWLGAGGVGEVVVQEVDSARVRVSPNGKRVAFQRQQSIWIAELGGGSPSRLTFERSFDPIFTPDGEFVVYETDNGVSAVKADGGGKPVKLLSGGYPQSISPDGRRLLVSTGGSRLSVATLGRDEGGLKVEKTEPLYAEEAAVVAPEFSPDGRWIAFRAVNAGSSEVVVRAFPDNGARYQVSTGGGFGAVWAWGKKELFWITLEGKVMVTPYTERGVGLVFGETKPGGVDLGPSGRLAAAPGGRMMTVHFGGAQGAETRAVFLLNFHDELKRRMAAAGVRGE